MNAFQPSADECLRRPWGREAELPSALVKNKGGFAAFEAGTSGLSILAGYEMTRRGHRRLARLGQTIDVVSIGYAVVHNYRLERMPAHSSIRGRKHRARRRFGASMRDRKREAHPLVIWLDSFASG